MLNSNPRWLGLVVAPPQIGAPLVIGKPGARDLTLTSTVSYMFPREDGVLVQTIRGSRYFIGIAGNTYRCDRVSDTDRLVDQTELDVPTAFHPALEPRGELPRPPRLRARGTSELEPYRVVEPLASDAAVMDTEPGCDLGDITARLRRRARTSAS